MGNEGEDIRCAIYIDVEGTSKIYSKGPGQFFYGFDELLKAIYLIGNNVFPEPAPHVSAHQVGGDGLVIISEWVEGSLERSISIAVVLLQVLLVNGLVASAGISKGNYSDVKGCLPSLREFQKVGAGYRLGARGQLTTLPCMGTALINAHLAASTPPRGCRLAVDPLLLPMPQGVVLAELSPFVVVDWIHSKTTTMELIAEKTELVLRPLNELEQHLASYVQNCGKLTSDEWCRNSLALNGCKARP